VNTPAPERGARALRLLRHAPAVLGVLLLLGAVFVVQREFRHLDMHDVGNALRAIPRASLLIAAGLTVFAYGVLTFYDRLGSIYAGRAVSYARAAFASFCAYSLAHNLGFAAVSGAAVRYRLYAHWGLTPLQIGKVVGFCSLTFGLGAATLGGAILVVAPGAVPWLSGGVPHGALRAIGVGMWAAVALYIGFSTRYPVLRLRGRAFELPSWRMALAQVLLASVDVAATAAIFYALLPHPHGVTFFRVLAVYLASYALGLVANVPGGLGVFDTAVLLGLKPFLPAPTIVGATFVFRLYYYIIPLFLSGTLFAANELLMRGRAFRAGPQGQKRWSEPDFAVAASTGAVAVCGAMLLVIGLADLNPDFSWLDPDLAALASGASEYVPSLIGGGLMVLAIGLARRVTLAWAATLVLLVAAAIVTALQGEPDWVPAFLLLAALGIAPFRRAYYRHAKLVSQPLHASTLVPMFTLVLAIVWLALVEPRTRSLAQTSWWAIVLSRETPVPVRAAMAVAVVTGLAALWGVVRPSRVRCLAWDGETRARFAALGAAPAAEPDGVVLGEGERAAIAFRRVGRVMLALGDPAGAPEDRVSAVWRLRDLARQEGLDPAVWRASDELLRLYADLGLTALPLGPDGLPVAETEAPASGRRYLCCVAERDLGLLLPLLPRLSSGLWRAAT
jgi:glycosyltransferase 2 family protein